MCGREVRERENPCGSACGKERLRKGARRRMVKKGREREKERKRQGIEEREVKER